MCDWAHPADPRCDYWHVLRAATLAEFVKATELRDLEVGVLHVPLVVEEDNDLAVSLKPSDRVDGYGLHFLILLLMMEVERIITEGLY